MEAAQEEFTNKALANKGLANGSLANEDLANEGLLTEGLPSEGLPSEGLPSEGLPLANEALPAAGLLTEDLDSEDGPIVELGDRIRVFGGKYDKTSGRVIYRTEDEIHIIPDGLTNKAIEFKLNEEGFDPESGVESVEILNKRKKPELVEILDLHVGQDLETFGPDGEPMLKYTIVKIIPEDDAIVIHNEGDEDDLTITFGFRGIPKDLPFRVIRGRQPTEKLVVDEETGEFSEEVPLNDEEDEEEQEDFTFLDDELEAPPAEFEEGVEKLIEIPRADRTYSNETQKSEAYADLLSLNTAAMQKLVDTQRATRILTELFFQLRASVLRTADDGTPKGVKPTSIQTLVDALETRLLVLSRCVVNVDKIIYHDMNTYTDPQPTEMEGLRLEGLEEKINTSNTYLESSDDMNGQKFNSFLNGYLNRFGATWRAASSPRIAFQRDEEVFRGKAPDAESTIPGFPDGLPDSKHGYLSAEMVSEVSMSLVRGLKAIKARSQIIQLGEEAAVLAYVLFPLSYASSLSTIRYESLIADVQASLKDTIPMKTILKELGDITDIPSTKQAFLVSVDGGTLGNIPLREYLKATGIRAEGMGDIWPLQTLMGLKDREWTIDQQEVLKEAITHTQNQILAEILRQRELLAQQVAQPPAVQGIQMTPDGAAMIEKLGSEPNLREFQDQIKSQMPAFANSDIAMVGLLIRQHPELSFAQLADQPAALTRIRMKYAREEYLKTLKEKQALKDRVNFAGKPPTPINCPHVRPLEMIRKVKDDKTRMALLSKFLTTFQGIKEDSWVKCNVGNHNLLCVHELLQIYQYLRPGDVSVLNKEIQLHFGGGQFQGYYICRNCGQPISEVEYDTHIEFDDNGKPMMGRSELVDKDAITEENIEQLIGPLGDVDEDTEFDNETKKLIYATAKQLADKLFAPLEKEDFMTIVNRVYGLIQQIPTRDRYVKLQQASRKTKTISAVAASTDYDIYINQALVCAVGVQMLLYIQGKTPDIILRGTPTGCRSLGGQPLEPEGGTQGIQCVISIISSFQKDTPPWSLTQFQKEADDTTRQKMISAIFEPILRSSLQDPMILQALSKKRDYRRKILGAAGGQGRPDEILPPNFAPIPYVMKEEDFVEKVIIPEAASEADRVELWIRQGNMIAKKHKMPMPLAFNEASCCLSPLENLDEFWLKSDTKQSLPPFPKRIGIKAPPRITRAEPTMKPSQIVRPLPDPPENSYYTLFLKVCYDGDKKGYSHEFGLTHKCIWCDLTLPKELEILTPEQGLAAIEAQGVEINKDTFEDLLNEVHKVNSFKTKLLTEVPGPLDNWTSLMEMEPEPATGYREAMDKTQTALMALPVDAKEENVAMALSDFSILAGDLEAVCKVRLSKQHNELLDTIVKDGAESIIRFLQSYLIVPLKQRLTNQVAMVSVPKSWGLSDQHKQDIVNIMASHRGYLAKFNKISITPWLTAKIETFLLQARSIINKLELLRPLQVPGGKQTYEFFLKFCLFAPLANFVDPNTLPIALGTEVPESQVEQQALFPAKFTSEMLNHFKDEGFKLTPEQIRELIAKRNEMEKSNIIKKMNDMSRAGKDIEKIKMKLGLGDWSVGGTKGIYAYDQDRYDIEREQRAEAGIIDFPGYGPEGHVHDGGQTDGLGYYNTGGDEAGYIGDEELTGIMGFDEDT